MEKTNNVKKTISIVTNVLLAIIFALSLFVVITTLSNKNGIPNIFGLGYLTVQSDSMDPTFKEGDLIFVTTTKSSDIFKENDIVTFRAIIDGKQVLNTHKIISFTTQGNTRYYTTQGDNETFADANTITAGDIVAKYTNHKFTGAGKVMDFFQSQLGFLLCIVMPLAGLFIYQIITFSILLANYKKDQLQVAGESIDLSKLSAEQKEQLAKMYKETLGEKSVSEDKPQAKNNDSKVKEQIKTKSKVAKETAKEVLTKTETVNPKTTAQKTATATTTTKKQPITKTTKSATTAKSKTNTKKPVETKKETPKANQTTTKK